MEKNVKMLLEKNGKNKNDNSSLILSLFLVKIVY